MSIALREEVAVSTESLSQIGRGTVATPAEGASPRYHSLDALRGIMMLLGLWLHAVVAYSRAGGWPWKDGTSTVALDWSIGLIHTFRMPAFFVMGGFFSALLIRRRGAAGFAWNRMLRIVVPFVVGWALLFPLVMALAAWGRNLGRPDVWAQITGFFSSGTWRGYLHPQHLWFLEYLIFFYVIALAIRPAGKLLPGVTVWLDRCFRFVFASWLRAVWFAALSFPTMWMMQHVWLDDPSGFLPETKIVLAYLVFFAAGWFLYRNVDLLALLRGGTTVWRSLGIGMLVWPLMYILGELSSQSQGAVSVLYRTGSIASSSLAMWLFIFGLTGLFLRYFDQPSARMRYLADSSYWIYILHMPVFLVLQIALAGTALPPLAKFTVLLVLSTPVLFASYHFLVRPTWVGVLLNGRRYPIHSSHAQRL